MTIKRSIQTRKGLVWLEFDKEQWKGCYFIWAHSAERSYLAELRVTHGWVSKIVVDDDYQRMGIATAMCEAVLSDYETLTLKHYGDSIDAQKLWESLARRHTSRFTDGWIYLFSKATTL